MRLWNTRTLRKEPFTAGEVVRLYVCGITPYDTTHLGHARTYLIFDVLVRELERAGHRVLYAQNVTDVDDPLYAKAKELGRTAADLAAEYTQIYRKDMASLGMREPDFFPYASGEIPEMQRLISTLLDRDNAYARDGRVYYRTASFPEFGRLSHLDRQQMIEVGRERGEDASDPLKEDPLDFLLWKPSGAGEDAWDSPWGPGRPGWHIECSAMAMKYLGPQLDIHGGGEDLIYPHHESEIAQSVAATCHAPFARYWMHAGMVELGGIKMSKSLGNLVLVRNLLPRFGPKAIRHYLLSTHYRASLDFDEAELKASLEKVERLDQAIRVGEGGVDRAALESCQARFSAAIDDDLDTPSALRALNDTVGLALDAPVPSPSVQAEPRLRAMAQRLGLA